MNNLLENSFVVIIFGLPRTGTTFLFDRFIAAGAMGSKQNRNVFKDVCSEEPSRIGKFAQECNGESQSHTKEILNQFMQMLKANTPAQSDVIITKHPLYTPVSHVIHQHLIELGIQHLMIGMTRNAIDQIISMDGQREYVHDLMRVKWPRRNLENLRFFFSGDGNPESMKPIYRSVYMQRSMEKAFDYSIQRINKNNLWLLNYENMLEYPLLCDALIKARTGLNVNLAENIRPGKGRSNENSNFNIKKIERLLWKN